jgi:hypothetical protein
LFRNVVDVSSLFSDEDIENPPEMKDPTIDYITESGQPV